LSAEPTRPWPLVVRVARPDDHDAVMAFATTTWDGWDYIPRAWPHWLTAPDGVLLVATAGRAHGGRPAIDTDGNEIRDDLPIAVARVAMLSPTEAWLEGIRVDPRVRGQGVATDFQVAELDWAAAAGATVVRYATGERNEASHRLGARHGFEVLAEFRLWQWHAAPPDEAGGHDEEEPSGFDDAVRAEANRARARVLDLLGGEGLACRSSEAATWWQRLTADGTFERAHGLCEQRGWTMQQLTRAMFEHHVARGEVLCREDASDGWSLAILTRDAAPAEDADLKFGLVAGRLEPFARLAGAVRLAAGRPISFWLPHPDPPLVDRRDEALNQEGFYPRPWSLHVLSRPLDAHNPPPTAHSPDALVLADEPVPLQPLVDVPPSA
jgi:RimJ/RimL family protein N-acetyltransferase